MARTQSARRTRSRTPVLAAAVAVGTSPAIAAGAGTAASAAPAAPARADQVPAEADGLGQLSGILPASKLTLPDRRPRPRSSAPAWKS